MRITFGFAAILTGYTWTSEPEIKISGGLGSVMRIAGTESFLLDRLVASALAAECVRKSECMRVRCNCGRSLAPCEGPAFSSCAPRS